MIKNIIFDFDGVLVDSEILVAKAFAKYMQNSGIDIDEKEFASLAGKKTVQVIDILSKKYSIQDQQKFYTDIMDIGSNIYKKELATVKGAYDFVRNLKLNIFIGSNSMKERILIGLKKLNFDKKNFHLSPIFIIHFMVSFLNYFGGGLAISLLHLLAS